MEYYLIYIVKVIALQALLFGIYWLISRKTISFQFNRFFLLSILIVPFFIPFLKIPITIFSQDISANGTFNSWYVIEQSLPNVVFTGSQSITSSFPWWITLLLIIYLIIVISSTIKLILDYFKICNLEKKCTRKEFTSKGFRLFYVPEKFLSFSFLNRIFISDLFPLKFHEKNTIIAHEEYHLTQRHSLDIVLAELIKILCWFNPIIMLIQKNLKETHEYLADRHTIAGYGKNEYATMLRSFSRLEINMVLGNAYSGSSISKRLNMMEHPNKKSPFLQNFYLIIIALFTAFLFACEDNLDSFENKDEVFQYEISEAELQKEIEKRVDFLKKQNAPQDMVDLFIREQNKYPEYVFRPYIMSIVNVDPEESMIPEKMKARIESGMLEKEVIYMRKVEPIENNRNNTNHFFSDKINSGVIVRSRFAFIEKIDRRKLIEYTFKMKGDTDIHDDCDKKPQFKGGSEKLTQYLKANLNYPEVARRLGIEDKVVLRFVVSKHGGLIYLNIDQEPSTSNEEASIELQKAAFHAIRSTSGMWQPAEKGGKYVASRMTLPIEFKFDK